MTDEPVCLVRPVVGSRVLAYLRHHVGRRPRRVLVAPSSARPTPTLAEVRGAAELWWVAVREFAEIRTFEMRFGAEGERAARVEVQLRWWVHDPRAVARHRAVDARSFVYRDVADRIHRMSADGEDPAEESVPAEFGAALSRTVVLTEYGLAYRPVGVFVHAEPISPDARAELDRLRLALASEKERQRLTLMRMEFHRALIREGPEALTAYWLTRFPDRIEAVLEHLADRPPTVAAEATPATELLALLGDADDFERNQLRKALVAGLAASGPRGVAVLRELGWWDDLAGEDARGGGGLGTAG